MVTTLVDMESAYFTAEFFRNAQAAAAAASLAEEEGGGDDGPSRAHANGGGGFKARLQGRAAEAPSEFSPAVEAHLTRVSATVAAYVASVCESL